MKVEGRYPRFHGYGKANHSSASLELLEASQADLYVWVDTLNISVYGAAEGAGICEIKDTKGKTVYVTSTEGVKDLSLDFGEGLKVDQGVGLLAAVSGGAIQGSVFVVVTGHYSGR